MITSNIKIYNYSVFFAAIEHGEWGGGGSCAQMLCECDKQLAFCLKRYPCPHDKALCHSSPLRLLQNVFML